MNPSSTWTLLSLMTICSGAPRILFPDSDEDSISHISGSSLQNQRKCKCESLSPCDKPANVDPHSLKNARCDSNLEERPEPRISSRRQVSRCGIRNPDGLGERLDSNNNTEAQYAEFPWMVAVTRTERSPGPGGEVSSVYECGGSLIHPQVVLTATHCVHRKNNLAIRAGEWDSQTNQEMYPTQDRNVRKVITHEQFDPKKGINNPALLILDQPVDMSEPNVGLICLPEADENMDNRDCVVSGWGKDKPGREGEYQVILKRIDLPVIPSSQCQETLRKTRLGASFQLHEGFICAGSIAGRDTCEGDGGSPLACPSKNNPDVYVQAGVVAWGISCGTGTPGVYVNVAHFINWVNNKLTAEGIFLN